MAPASRTLRVDRRRRGPIALALAASLGCSSTTPDPPALSRCDAVRQLRTTLYPAGVLTDADEADVASRVVPGGFGGLFMDFRRSVLTVALVDLAQQGRAAATIDSLITCGAIYPGRLGTSLAINNKEFRQVRHTAQELRSWLGLVRSRAPGRTWALEIDPIANHVWAGTLGLAASDTIGRLADSLRIPETGLVIEAPPADSAAGAFRVAARDIVVTTVADIGFYFSPVIWHLNEGFSRVFQDRCPIPGQRGRSEPLVRLEKWEPAGWRVVYRPICNAVIINPVSVGPGESRTDTVSVTAVTRLNSEPVWNNVRVAGTYRFVVPLFQAAVGVPPQLVDPLPDSSGRSQTFRLRLP